MGKNQGTQSPEAKFLPSYELAKLLVLETQKVWELLYFQKTKVGQARDGHLYSKGRSGKKEEVMVPSISKLTKDKSWGYRYRKLIYLSVIYDIAL